MYPTRRFPIKKSCKNALNSQRRMRSYPLIHLADARVCPIFFLLPSAIQLGVCTLKFYFHSQRCNATHPFTKGVYTLIYTLSQSVSAVFFIRFNCPLTQHLFVCICIALCSLNTFCFLRSLQAPVASKRPLAQRVHLYSNRCAF
jgi:hypothetical protein